MSDIDQYAQMQREYYNTRAVNKDAARGLVHPDYAYAAAQAPGFIRFVLNSYYSVHAPHRLPEADAEALGSVKQLLRVRRGILREWALRLLGAAPDAGGRRALDALDFGCGVGRLMRPLKLLGARVDGVDVSRGMLDFARADPLLEGSRFFEAGGADCGEAPAAAYDIVYSAICMQHIASRTIRRKILADMRRVLRPGGMVMIQFHYYPDLDDAGVPAPHVPWMADAFDAKGTNSDADVWITPQSLPGAIADFRECFDDVAVHFCGFPQEAKLFRGAYGEHRFEHVMLSGTAGLTRAEAIYSL